MLLQDPKFNNKLDLLHYIYCLIINIPTKMKKTLTILTVVVSMTACQSTRQNAHSSEDILSQETIAVGGDRDQHGCLTAAGLTWSQIKNDCIQVFSEGIRLNPVSVASTQATISAFVVPNDEFTAYELFIPHTDGTIILKQVSEGVFQNKMYTFNKNLGSLYQNDVLTFRIEIQE